MKTTMHGIEIKSAEEELHDLDDQIREAMDDLTDAIRTRSSADQVNTAGWKLRDLLTRWNAAMNRWKLEGNSEKEYFARKEEGKCIG